MAAVSSATATPSGNTDQLTGGAEGEFVLGIDPGAKYVGVVARTQSGSIGWAETFTGDFTDTTQWIHACLDRITSILTEIPTVAMGVETITSPKGFRDGARSPINPGHVARTAAIYGAVVGRWPSVIAVPPAGNGSKPAEYYPVELVGRRPKSLPGLTHPGVKTRSHEQSAFDIAGTTWQAVLDARATEEAA